MDQWGVGCKHRGRVPAWILVAPSTVCLGIVYSSCMLYMLYTQIVFCGEQGIDSFGFQVDQAGDKYRRYRGRRYIL